MVEEMVENQEILEPVDLEWASTVSAHRGTSPMSASRGLVCRALVFRGLVLVVEIIGDLAMEISTSAVSLGFRAILNNWTTSNMMSS